MGRAKDLQVQPVAAADANKVVRALHYSGKVVPNSQVHLGVFLDGKCGGVMQFGPSLNGVHMRNLVKGTQAREHIELNRIAFADWLPRNSESRCLGVALRLLRRNYNHLKWVVSFADACQCGDGAIYRAAGFLLVDIRKNSTLRYDPITNELKTGIRAFHEGRWYEVKNWKILEGYMLKYVYFLKPQERANLTVPVLPYSRIKEEGVGMYRGQKCAGSIGNDAPGDQPGEGGASPTPALQP